MLTCCCLLLTPLKTIIKLDRMILQIIHPSALQEPEWYYAEMSHKPYPHPLLSRLSNSKSKCGDSHFYRKVLSFAPMDKPNVVSAVVFGS